MCHPQPLPLHLATRHRHTLLQPKILPEQGMMCTTEVQLWGNDVKEGRGCSNQHIEIG